MQTLRPLSSGFPQVRSWVALRFTAPFASNAGRAGPGSGRVTSAVSCAVGSMAEDDWRQGTTRRARCGSRPGDQSRLVQEAAVEAEVRVYASPGLQLAVRDRRNPCQGARS